jgi:hypothetical protein
MRLVALGAAGAIVAAVSTSGVEAADFAYPPAAVGPPEYGVAAPPAVAPPQVLVVPGAPDVVPWYNAAPVPPAVVRPSPYGEAPPVAPPGVAPGPSPTPRAACGPVWRCGSNGCGWDSSCAPYPEPYAFPHRSPGPPVYSPGPPAPQPYGGPNGVPGPRVYSGTNAPPAPEPYSVPYEPQGSGPYTPQLYSGPPGQMRWIIGPQPYGM